jgi:AcrR family transcriptional regulator
MSKPLPLLTAAAPERRDAARNRETLLREAIRIVDAAGTDGLTMDAVAAAAGVGKGTVFRRFGNREGLMAAVLDHSETEWQAAVMGGPPPLGPGAAPLERLDAFGESRMRLNVRHADLIVAAGRQGDVSLEAISFTTMHVRILLAQLGVRGDLPYLASALVSPLELFVRRKEPITEETLARMHAGWSDLVRRVVAG